MLATYGSLLATPCRLGADRPGRVRHLRPAQVVVAGAGGRPGRAACARLGRACGSPATRRRPPRWCSSSRWPRRRTCGAGSRICATPPGWACRSRWWRRAPPRFRSSSRAGSGSSARGSTRTCRSTSSPRRGSSTAEGASLIAAGYPLGPHSLVAAVSPPGRVSCTHSTAWRWRWPSPPASRRSRSWSPETPRARRSPAACWSDSPTWARATWSRVRSRSRSRRCSCSRSRSASTSSRTGS